jgi:hypothetical protein
VTAVSRARSRVALFPVLLSLLAAIAFVLVAAPTAPAHGGDPYEHEAPTPPDDLKVLIGGATELILDPGAVEALAGVPVRPIGPAYAVQGGFAFPITVGIVHEGGGKIVHKGGLRIGKGPDALRLKRFLIDLDNARLTAHVRGVGRVPILALELVSPTPEGAFAAAVGRITPEAAQALGNPALAGAVLGTAFVRPKHVF